MKNNLYLRSLAKPLLSLPIFGRVLRCWKIRRQYVTERQVLKGRHKKKNNHQSFVFFTVHKAGSSFIGSFIHKIVRESGLVPVDLDGYFFNLGKGKDWEVSGRNMGKIHYQNRGYFYGPFRSYHRGIQNLEDFKVLLVLRDPRDVIVSSYFSLYSHAIPIIENAKKQKARMERRKKWLSIGIDQYVFQKLNKKPNYLDRYQDYFKPLLGKPNVLFLKYEDMILHFESWLDNVLDFFSLKISPHLRHEIIRLSDFKAGQENIYNHKRQVLPGDHRRKLKKETIVFLNAQTEDILHKLDY